MFQINREKKYVSHLTYEISRTEAKNENLINFLLQLQNHGELPLLQQLNTTPDPRAAWS